MIAGRGRISLFQRWTPLMVIQNSYWSALKPYTHKEQQKRLYKNTLFESLKELIIIFKKWGWWCTSVVESVQYVRPRFNARTKRKVWGVGDVGQW